ncbi:MAG: GNAT family N-acetyltransferase [Pseudomonadota bacterium]
MATGTAEVLTTDRLVLRAPSWRDAVFVFRLLSNAETRRYLGGPAPFRRRVARTRWILAAGDGTWLVAGANCGVPMGLISLHAHHDEDAPEMSYEFHPSAWGQGHATEACRCVMAHAFDRLGVDRLVAETQAANGPSRRLLDRLGFIPFRRIERFGAAQVVYVADAPPGRRG